MPYNMFLYLTSQCNYFFYKHKSVGGGGICTIGEAETDGSLNLRKALGKSKSLAFLNINNTGMYCICTFVPMCVNMHCIQQQK